VQRSSGREKKRHRGETGVSVSGSQSIGWGGDAEKKYRKKEQP